MKRWFLFLFCICGISLYIFRLYTWPSEDRYLKQIADELKGKEVIWKIEVIDEPEIKTYAVDIVGYINAYCFDFDNTSSDSNGGVDHNSRCQKLDKDERFKTKIYISKSKFKGKETSHIDMEDIRVGDILEIRGGLKLLSEDKGLDQANQSATSTALQKRIEINNKKHKIFSTIQVSKLVQVEQNNGFHFKRFLIEVRTYIESSIARFIPEPESDLAAGLVVSGKDSLSKEILEEFKRVGLIHIVVLSGSNVSIISQALFKVLGFAPLFFRTILGIFFMACFAIMTGASPPVVRSVFMSSVPLLISPFVGRNTKLQNHSEAQEISLFENNATLSILLFVVLIMSIINPLYPIYDISFQLSFLATFGLIVLSSPIAKRLTFIPRFFGVREIVAASLATQIYIAPLLLHMSGGLSIVFIIANIVVLPILPLLMFLIFLIPFTSFIAPMLADIIGKVSYFILHFIMQYTHWLSTFPLAVVDYDGLSGPITSLIYFFLFLITVIFLSFPHGCE
jgi:ComEC/Rec2-related protein